MPDESGKLMHSEVRLYDSVVVIADSVPNWPAVPGTSLSTLMTLTWLASVRLTQELDGCKNQTKKHDDDKRVGVEDAGETTWWIATKVT